MDTITFHTVAPEPVDHARRTGVDMDGTPVEQVTAPAVSAAAVSASTDAEPGANLLLMGYRPRLPASPYVETGAVFVHAGSCTGPASTTSYPQAWRSRPAGAARVRRPRLDPPATRTHDGTDPEQVLAEVLAEPGVVEVHGRRPRLRLLHVLGNGGLTAPAGHGVRPRPAPAHRRGAAGDLEPSAQSAAQDLTLHVIGHVRSTLTSRADAPRPRDEGAPEADLHLTDDVAPALSGITVGDDLLVLAWLHQGDRSTLTSRPRNDPARPETGIFATRSPDRPNPLGLHRVTVLAVDGIRLDVSGLEAIDGTPSST